MSDYRSIAMVSLAMQHIIQSEINEVLPSALVTHGAPDTKAKDTKPEASLCLYHSAAITSLRNSDLAGRDFGVSSSSTGQLPVNLYYLVSFSGAGVEPDLMLGRVISHFHSHPQIAPAWFQDIAKGDSMAPTGAHLLKGNDLAEQAQPVWVTPVPLGFDKVTQIWTSFTGVNHRPAVMFEVGPVVIDGGPSSYLDDAPTQQSRT